MPPQYNKVINKVINKEKDTLTSVEKEKATAVAVATPAPVDKSVRFIPPSVEEVAEYCAQRCNDVDAEHFCNYYASCGWMVGKGKKMKDWRAAVRTWENNGINNKIAKQNGNTRNERMAAARADIIAGIATAEQSYRRAQGKTCDTDTSDLFGEV